MGTQSAWRWVSHLIVGALFISVVLVTGPSKRSLESLIGAPSVFFSALLALLAYLVGVLVWACSISAAGWLRSLSIAKDANEVLEQARATGACPDELGDIKSYTQLLEIIVHATEDLPQFLGLKLRAAWESASMMRVVGHTTVVGIALVVGRWIFQSAQDPSVAVAALGRVGALVILGALSAMSAVAHQQRIRLLARDVALAVIALHQRSGVHSPGRG